MTGRSSPADLTGSNGMAGATGTPAHGERALETTLDGFFNGRLMLSQPRLGLRAGMDALLLAASVSPASTDREGTPSPVSVLDLGTGCGIAALATATRLPTATVIGVDLMAPLIALANDNARRNDLANRAGFIVGDIQEPGSGWQDQLAQKLASLRRRSPERRVDHVIANPPYYPHGTARPSPDPVRAAATVLGPGGLEPWIACAARWLAPGGLLTMINRSAGLPAILSALAPRFGSLVVLPVHSQPALTSQLAAPPSPAMTPSPARPGAPGQRAAELVLLRARRGGKAPLRLLPGLTTQLSDGTPSPALTAIARHGASLTLLDPAS